MKPKNSLVWLALAFLPAAAGADWKQFQGDRLRSGNAPHFDVAEDLGLAAAIPTTDAIFAAPVVIGSTAYVIDGSGVVFAIDTRRGEVLWQFQTKGGAGNCNNVASPAVISKFLHVGTMAGFYYVLNRETGEVIKEIDCGEPIFSAPAAGGERVYFATLGAKIYALETDGEIAWTWDFVREVVGFEGNRWKGEDWVAFRGDRVNWKDHFVCSRDISAYGDVIVMPAGGRTVFVEDKGEGPELRAIGEIPSYAGKEYPATFGQSIGQDGRVYVQWHRRDNSGRTDTMKLGEDNELEFGVVSGTETLISIHGLLSFAPLSIRDENAFSKVGVGSVYRVRPENGVGLCRHHPDLAEPEVISAAPAISPAILTRNHAVYGGLDGKLHIAPLEGGETRSLDTAFGAPISAGLAVSDDRIFVPSEDGYLYIFAPGGDQQLPNDPLPLTEIRSRLTGKLAGPEFDWYTNYGDFSGTNANDQGLKPPLRMRWARRLEGTVKHLPVCGGGRLYIQTAEGQINAFEQDTGRLLWRRYWPDVYLSFVSPLYVDGKLLVPQAGMKRSLMRCLDAATGELLWEAPFTGSPSWSRQFPPVVHDGIAIYASGSGEYAAQGSEKYFTFKGDPNTTEDGREVMSWIYSNDNPYYPKDHKPRLWAWDLETGEVVWEKDFSDEGAGGNDCGICILDGKLYYSVFFGYSTSQKKRRGLPVENNGLTACLDPKTGDVIWKTNDFYVTSKCTLSARDGRIFIGGFNRAQEGTDDRFVWCLDAETGKLVWQSEPVTSALNVVSVGEKYIFSNALRGKGNVFDRETGKVVSQIGHNYACCRFTLSGSYVLGANMDMIDLSQDGKLVSTGPAIDSRECLGAVVSNGRIFYISQASGFLVSQTYGEESENLPAVWER